MTESGSDIDNLVNKEFCNPYTNPNYTIYNEAIQICAGPYEAEVPLKDPDHNFAGVSYEIYRKVCPVTDTLPTATNISPVGSHLQRHP